LFFFQDEEIEIIYFLWILYFSSRSLTILTNAIISHTKSNSCENDIYII